MAHKNYTQDQIESIFADVESSTLIDEPTRALLKHTEKVTRHAYKVTQADIQTLGDVGFSDSAILEATFVMAGFGLFTRISDALGATVENLREAVAQGNFSSS